MPADPTSAKNWRHAVGCTTWLGMPNMLPLLEALDKAVGHHSLTPLEMLLIGNLLAEASKHQFNKHIAADKRQYLPLIYAATEDVASDYTESFRANGLPKVTDPSPF